LSLEAEAVRIFPHALSGFGGLVYAVILTLVALGLMFAGSRIIKGLGFLVVGFAGAAFGIAIGGTVLGLIGSIFGAFFGFLIGGVIGLFLVSIGMGLALGYFAYLATNYLTHSVAFALIVGIALFLVGLAISRKLLAVVTAALGGIILYSVMVYFGFSSLEAGLLAFVFALAGYLVQRSSPGHRQGWGRKPWPSA